MARTFEVYNEKTVSKLGTVYGVYALAYGMQNTNSVHVFYVGSGNIQERLMHHLSDLEENSCVKNNVSKYACFFWYEEVQGGEEKRTARESELITTYQKDGKAECNKKNP